MFQDNLTGWKSTPDAGRLARVGVRASIIMIPIAFPCVP